MYAKSIRLLDMKYIIVVLKAIKSEDTIQFQAEIQRLKMQLIQKEADIVSLGAEVQQEQAHLKKMELEVSRDKLLREKERESLIRQNRIDKENIQDLERKIIHLNRRQINKHQYEHMKQLKSAHQDTSEHQNEVERLSDEMTQLRDENYELRADFEQKEIDYRKSIQEFESKNSELEERLSVIFLIEIHRTSMIIVTKNEPSVLESLQVYWRYCSKYL